MSMGPRVYHGDEVKCSGYGRCRDCTERIDNERLTGIPGKRRDLFAKKDKKSECANCACSVTAKLSCECDCHKEDRNVYVKD